MENKDEELVQGYTSAEAKKNVLNRLSRLAGQINGVSRMLENDRSCDEVLVQLSAIDKSIKAVVSILLENQVYNVAVPAAKKGNMSTLSEALELYKRFF
ncbi:MAG: metal-sensitive transcriptional regulator [Clostridia bacterium]|nr:metal-sensitive transcriptional regulator [Clostridia bacterium]